MKNLVLTLIAMILVAGTIILCASKCNKSVEVAESDMIETGFKETLLVVIPTQEETTTTSITTSTTSAIATTTTEASSTTLETTTMVVITEEEESVDDNIVEQKNEEPQQQVVREVVKEVYEDIPNTTIKETTATTSTTVSTVKEEETTVTEEAAEVQEETTRNMVLNTTITELTYYSGPKGCSGRWGRKLINNYSIASNLLPDGTLVHIESADGSINGDYRVDDTGGMGNHVIDIFFSDYSNVPYPFSRDGRIKCTAWVIEE